jgi:hypothetical protein
MQAEAAGTQVVEIAAVELCGVDGLAGVAEDDLDAAAGMLWGRGNAGTDDLDGAAGFAFVGVAEDVGEGFIDGADHGPGLLRGEIQGFGGALDGGADDAQDFGIALELEAQEEVGWELCRRCGWGRRAFCSKLSSAHNPTVRKNENP